MLRWDRWLRMRVLLLLLLERMDVGLWEIGGDKLEGDAELLCRVVK